MRFSLGRGVLQSVSLAVWGLEHFDFWRRCGEQTLENLRMFRGR